MNKQSLRNPLSDVKINPLSPSQTAILKKNRRQSSRKAGKGGVETYDPTQDVNRKALLIKDGLLYRKRRVELEYDNRNNDQPINICIGSSFLPLTTAYPGHYMYPTYGTFKELTSLAMHNMFCSRRASVAKFSFTSKTGDSYEMEEWGRFGYGIWMPEDVHSDLKKKRRVVSDNIDKQFKLIELDEVIDPNEDKRNLKNFKPYFHDAFPLPLGDFEWIEKGIAPGDYCYLTLEIGILESGYIGEGTFDRIQDR